MITSAISTQDPGDLYEVIGRLQTYKIQTSILNLSVKNYIGEQITKFTGGEFRLSKDPNHFKTLLMIYIQPKSLIRDGIVHEMIKIGFPEKKANKHAFDANNKRCFEFFVCPVCKAKNSSLPTNCGVCKTLLASAPFIARTENSSLQRGKYELIRVEGFQSNHILIGGQEKSTMEREDVVKFEDVKDRRCAACDEGFDKVLTESNGVISNCPKCRNLFCLNCDIYIHSNLYQCPLCEI